MRRMRPSDDYEQTIKRIGTRVLYLLEKYPSARNSDSMLLWLYGRHFLGLKLPYIDFKTLRGFNLEAVTRVRRRIQNYENMFLPTDPTVRAARRRKSQAMKAFFAETDN